MKCLGTLLATVILSVVVVGSFACSSESEADTRDDKALCNDICSDLAQVCASVHTELKGKDCNAECLDAKDSSTAFRRCLADSKTCDDMNTCKSTH